MLMWAKGLSRVVAQDGVTVNCVSPGYLLTEQIRNDREIPARRFGDPADAANLTTFFCSPLAGYSTGQRVYVDGGWNRHV